MKQLTPREELIKIHKRIFEKNKLKIIDRTVIDSQEFNKYEKEYEKACTDYKKISTYTALYKKIDERDILYVGDYHTLQQAQKFFLKIAKKIRKKSKKIIFALEAINANFQDELDTYLDGRILEEDFIKKIGYKKYWIFDIWQNFQPIFHYAREEKIPCFGIDFLPRGKHKIEKRDSEAAKIISKLAQNFNDYKILVLVGDLHISPTHLPQAVTNELEKRALKKSYLIIYQNVEKLYWKLVEKGLEHTKEVLEIDRDSFCVINSSPIIKQQSFLNWIEHEEGLISQNAPKKNFKALARRIAEFLDIHIEDEIGSFRVYTCGDLSFLEDLKKDKNFSKKEIKIIKNQILASESYYIPKRKIVYLANLSLNHAAEEASHFIRHVCSGEEEPQDFISAFYSKTLNEALGFFGSKIVNHKRKCPKKKMFSAKYALLKNKKRTKEDEFEFLLAHYILMHKKFEMGFVSKNIKELFLLPQELFIAVTHVLGYMLGERMYNFLIEGKIAKDFIRNLFFNPFEEKDEARKTYFELIRILN